MKIILASRSKYKKKLLKTILKDFSTQDANIDESQIKQNERFSPTQKAKKLALFKAQVIFAKNPKALVIGSDQILVFNNKILSKPGNIKKAIEQLSQLSGKTHYLYTAYAILYKDTQKVHMEKTTLNMRSLTNLEIKRYISLEKPIDTVGSYKLESLGISLFDKVLAQDFNSIVGLPLLELSKDLRSFGLKIP